MLSPRVAHFPTYVHSNCLRNSTSSHSSSQDYELDYASAQVNCLDFANSECHLKAWLSLISLGVLSWIIGELHGNCAEVTDLAGSWQEGLGAVPEKTAAMGALQGLPTGV